MSLHGLLLCNERLSACPVRRTMAINVSREARRSILVDLLTVHALGGKAIVFTQTKREADEVAASLSLVHPCEVSPCNAP